MTHAMTSKHDHRHHTKLIVEVDRLGGAELSVSLATHGTIVDTSLRHLDIRDCHHLVALDLKTCQPGMHITIIGCDRLAWLRVPSEGHGVVVHLDSGSYPPSLVIEGPVNELDACWHQGHFAVRAQGRPWQGAVVQHASALSDFHDAHPQAECWIALQPTDEEVILDAPQLRQLLLQNADQLQTLQLTSMGTGTPEIEAQGLTRLSTLTVEAPEGRCRIRHSPQLHQLSGRMGLAHLASCGAQATSLDVSAICGQLVLRHCQLERLRVAHPTDLHLAHCGSAMTPVSLAPTTTITCKGSVPPSLADIAQISVDESLVAGWVHAFATSPQRSLDQLALLLPSMSSPREAVKALQLLAQLAEQGADPESLWSMRLALSARHQSPHGKRHHASRLQARMASARGRWQWTLPPDLGGEGWWADYVLWAYCGAWCDEAYRFRRAMLNACKQDPNSLAMQTVMNAMVRHGHHPQPHEIDVWSDLLDAMASAEPQQAPPWLHDAKARVIHYGQGAALDTRWLSACEATLPLGAYLDVLSRVGVEKPEVRARLLRIACKPVEWRVQRSRFSAEADQHRARAMSLALSTPSQRSR